MRGRARQGRARARRRAGSARRRPRRLPRLGSAPDAAGPCRPRISCG